MSVARLRITQAGPLTTIQDAGRPGWRRFGVPPSGPVDRLAFAAAHAALGNSPGGAGIECSLGGLALTCDEGEIAIALTGDGFTGTIDGVPIGGWTSTILSAGMTLCVREGASGNWGYLAVAGSLAARSWLGSRSTHLLADLGGGRCQPGDILTIDHPRATLAIGPIAPPPADDSARIVIGPQQRFFDSDVIARLTTDPFTATARFDRMGMQLDGPPLLPRRIDMPSEPAVRGALQVDGEGRLSLLTADHQTTGGYPRGAVVIDADVDRLAQRHAGMPIRFVAVSPDEAIAATRAADAENRRYLAALAAAVRNRPSLLEANLVSGVVDALDSVGDAEIEQQQHEQHRHDQREIE